MEAPKPFRSYEQQLDQLLDRGLIVDDPEQALAWLARVNYYRLSGYWYPFRRAEDGRRLDEFRHGAAFTDVIALYEFDERLRTAVFAALAPVELSVRAHLGHALGRLDAAAHLAPEILGPLARKGDAYPVWRRKFELSVSSSREEFVEHHRTRYGGVLPVWAAVEVLDWGALVRLFEFAPPVVQHAVATEYSLRAPQLTSWLRALNTVRNACAHHGRLFNRVYSKRPKLPPVGSDRSLDFAAASMNRTFGQLTLVQFLRNEQGVGPSRLMSRVIESHPDVRFVSPAVIGTRDGWQDLPLWR
ncbi:abortive infection bacteriophage resistance protein [Curtobacterium sp. ZW137]|nr:abortive infection bacteriophage resistance protein [Curtobacterium sp. ZW137]